MASSCASTGTCGLSTRARGLTARHGRPGVCCTAVVTQPTALYHSPPPPPCALPGCASDGIPIPLGEHSQSNPPPYGMRMLGAILHATGPQVTRHKAAEQQSQNKTPFRGGFRTAPAQPGHTPANHPPTAACMIHSKWHRRCRIQDPGTRGYRWWKTADFSHSARCAPSVTLPRAPLAVTEEVPSETVAEGSFG